MDVYWSCHVDLKFVSWYIKALIPHTHADSSARLPLAAANATKQWGGGDNEDSSSSRLQLLAAALLAAARRESTFLQLNFTVTYPQKPQGQRGGITLMLLGGLLPSLPVSPMSVLPCDALRVADESGDEAWALYKIHCFRQVQSTRPFIFGVSVDEGTVWRHKQWPPPFRR